MPNKATYGKRKSLLPFFSVYRDEDGSSHQSPSEKSKKRVSATISMAAFCGVNSDKILDIPSGLDDSIEEMASRLLDDTTADELNCEPEKRLSSTEPAKNLTQLGRNLSSDGKPLPQLPQLLFNGDDVWAMRSSPVVTAAGMFNQADFIHEDDNPDSCPPPVARVPKHTRKLSTPPLPRKSSKRKARRTASSGQTQKQTSDNANVEQTGFQKLTKTIPPSLTDDNMIGGPACFESRDSIHQAVAATAASKAPKSVDDITDSEILKKPGKNRSKGSNVLAKMKHAINERLHDSGLKKRQNRVSGEYLLGTESSQLTDYDEGSSTISSIEKRINEGTNLNNPKIQSLTGHGSVRRKPLGDDSKPHFSRQSIDDPFSENPHDTKARDIARLENQRMSGMSFEKSFELRPSMSEGSHRRNDDELGLPNLKRADSTFVVDFDTLFSSSPLAQSTPRIRLEPTFEENGGKKLRHVPAEFHSVFDHDDSPIDNSPSSHGPRKTQGRKVVSKRNNSQVKDVALGVKSHTSKRRKKHPSPSKAELEGLEEALKHYSPRIGPVDADMQDELTASFGELRTGGGLQPKDKNVLLKESAKRATKGNRLGIFEKSKPLPAAASMAEPAWRPGVKPTKVSMIPKPAGVPSMKRRTESRVYQHSSQTNASLMDTDELQWDITACNI